MSDGTETEHPVPTENTTIVRGPQFPPAYYRPWLRFIDTPDSPDGGDGGEDGDKDDKGKQDQPLTQADVDRIVRDRVAREKAKYADYDELKAKAEGAKTVEQKLADLETKYSESEARALRSDIAARHGVSAEDRDLFLTGTDEATLTAQAERLAQREADRKKNGNVAPKEGKQSIPKATDERATVRALFGRAD